jgi:GTP cyclohydrolase FolE2
VIRSTGGHTALLSSVVASILVTDHQTEKGNAMSRKSTLVRKLTQRRTSREFERALRNASPSMAQELRAIASRSQVGGL